MIRDGSVGKRRLAMNRSVKKRLAQHCASLFTVLAMLSQNSAAQAAQPSQLGQAETLIEQHDFAKARQQVLEALTANPKDVRAIYDLGYIEESTDHAKEAEQDYR